MTTAISTGSAHLNTVTLSGEQPFFFKMSIVRLAASGKPLTTGFAVMRYGRPSTSIGNAVPVADATLISKVRRRRLAVS